MTTTAAKQPKRTRTADPAADVKKAARVVRAAVEALDVALTEATSRGLAVDLLLTGEECASGEGNNDEGESCQTAEVGKARSIEVDTITTSLRL